MPVPELGKILIVSPHLDDAVLSCGELIAQHPGAAVLTVFAGVPENAAQQTDWDAASGFRNAGEAMTARRGEDREALQTLAATPVWLEFLDSQYHASPQAGALDRALHAAIIDISPTSVLLPSGLFHSDHLLVHQAMMRLRGQHPGQTWLMYEEALYRCIPGLLQQRLASLSQLGVQATPLAFRNDAARRRKQRAVQAYASQLRALQATVRDGYADAFAPERYWRLEPHADHGALETRGDEHAA